MVEYFITQFLSNLNLNPLPQKLEPSKCLTTMSLVFPTFLDLSRTLVTTLITPSLMAIGEPNSPQHPFNASDVAYCTHVLCNSLC